MLSDCHIKRAALVCRVCQRALRAQRLETRAPFGKGPGATRLAVEHLGYVQIDTINVIERSHHHILFTRIPEYQREHLRQAQSIDKSVFEYWTHAMSYVPTRDFRFFVAEMRRYRKAPSKWFDPVTPRDKCKVLGLLLKNGALTIRDIDDDVLVDKDHEWASRKPSKRALQLLFHCGIVPALDLKTDRERCKLLVQKWNWIGGRTVRAHKRSIEEELHRFERFQLA